MRYIFMCQCAIRTHTKILWLAMQYPTVLLLYKYYEKSCRHIGSSCHLLGQAHIQIMSCKGKNLQKYRRCMHVHVHTLNNMHITMVGWNPRCLSISEPAQVLQGNLMVQVLLRAKYPCTCSKLQSNIVLHCRS